MIGNVLRPLRIEIAKLRASGSEVTLIVPDARSLQVFGMNLMDGRRREPSAIAGFAQGKAEARRMLEMRPAVPTSR